MPFLAFSAPIRRAIYTTNAIESLNSTVRRAIRARRLEALRSGRKVDRDWRYATKLGMVILTPLAAAYVVHATLL